MKFVLKFDLLYGYCWLIVHRVVRRCAVPANSPGPFTPRKIDFTPPEMTAFDSEGFVQRIQDKFRVP